jgi:hypothetical protein
MTPIWNTSSALIVQISLPTLIRPASENSIGPGLWIGCVVWALLLIAATRGRLGYPRYQREAESLDLPPSTEPALPPPVGR